MSDAAQTMILLDDPERGPGACRLLRMPERIIVAWLPEEVSPALAEIERARADGLWAAGFFSYELGYLQEPRLVPLLPPERDVPLLWMGLFRHVQPLDAAAVRSWLPCDAEEPLITDVRPSMDREAYCKAFRRVRELIARGEVYQINLTLKLAFAFRGNPLALYAALRRRQRVGHGALIACPGFHLLSLSPEMFLNLRNDEAMVRPMKGTAARGATPEADAAIRQRLSADAKTQAENLMIVDLLRNDLSRLAAPGDVRVTDLFSLETYRTLHQMTSGIAATLRPGVGLSELLRALFPCGSVTGAPKIRAMQIIRALEPHPRGVYCGAVGLLAPDGDALLNVAIRTLLLRPDGRGELGIGSGVIYESHADTEYDECLLKAAFLTRPDPPLTLVETLCWQEGEGYALLDRHVQRLLGSASWFQMPCDEAAARLALAQAATSFVEPMRVRLLLDEEGHLTVTAQPLPEPRTTPLRWRFARQAVCPLDPFLYHKTTRRPLYDQELARARAAGCDEVLFRNDTGELTEGAWNNLFIRRGGRLLTPPVACGLLNGTLRQHLLQQGVAEEAVLWPKDLAEADAILFGNSVRGLVTALPASEG